MKYCHFFSPPKTGKTRVLTEIKAGLRKDNIVSGIVSCSQLVEPTLPLDNQRDYYAEIVNKLWIQFCEQVEIPKELQDLYNKNYRYISKSDELVDYKESDILKEYIGNFIQNILLSDIFLQAPIKLSDSDNQKQLSKERQIVIFFDDIDQLFELKVPILNTEIFIGNLFQTISNCQNRQRSSVELSAKYKRLCIVLSGSTPIKDLTSKLICNPFANSTPIPCRKFQLEEDLQNNDEVKQWLSSNSLLDETLLGSIYDATQGHPHLTIYLLDKIVVDESLRDLQARLLRYWEDNDELSFLKRVQERLQDFNPSSTWLLYQQILSNENIDSEKNNLDHERLQLLGIIQDPEPGTTLKVYNSFIQEILQKWNKKDLKPKESGNSSSNSLSEETGNPSTKEPVNSSPNSSRFWQWIETNIPKLVEVGFGTPGLRISEAIVSFLKLLKLNSLWNWIKNKVSSFRWNKWQKGLILFILGILIFIGLSSGIGWTGSMYLETQRDKLNERAATIFREDGESFQLKSLVEAVKLGREVLRFQRFLQRLPLPHHSLQPFFPFTPKFLLQQLYYNIREQNYLSHNSFQSFSAVAISPSGHKIAAAGVAKNNDLKDVIVWDSEKKNGANNHDMWSTGSTVNDLVFSSDESKIALVGQDGYLQIRSLSGRTLDRKSSHDGKAVLSVSLRPPIISNSNPHNLEIVATTGADGLGKLWTLRGNQIQNSPIVLEHRHSPDADSTNVTDLGFILPESNDDTNEDPFCLITVGQNSSIKLWSINQDGRSEPKLVDQKDESSFLINSVAVSSDGKKIAVGGKQDDPNPKGKVIVFEINKAGASSQCGELKSLDFSFESLDKVVTSVDFVEIPDRQYLVAVGERGLFKVWFLPVDVNTAQPELIMAPQIYAEDIRMLDVMLDSSKGIFVTVADDQHIRLWDLEEKDERKLIQVGQPGGNGIIDIAVRLKKDGANNIFVVTAEGKLTAYNAELEKSGFDESEAKCNEATSASSDAKGEKLITGNKRGFICVWNWADTPITFRKSIEIKDGGINGEILDLVFDPTDDSRLAVAIDKYVLLWDISENESGKLGEPLSNGEKVQALDISPDGRYLATLGDDKVKLWDISDHSNFVSIEKLDGDPTVRDIKFMPNDDDDIVLATIDERGQRIDFWTIEKESRSQKKAGTIDAGLPSGLDPKAKPDWDNPNWKKLNVDSIGKRLAVGGDREVRVWDISVQPWKSQIESAKRVIASFESDWQGVTSLNFGFDDKSIVAGGSNGQLVTARIGELDINLGEEGETLLEWSCRWLEDYKTWHQDDTDLANICNRGN